MNSMKLSAIFFVSLILVSLVFVVVPIPSVSASPDILTIRPNGDGDSVTWDIYPTSPTTHYDKVDEETPNNDTDYVTTGTYGEVERFQLQDHTTQTGTISNLTVKVYAKYYSSTYKQIKITIKTGGSTYSGSTITLTSSYAYYEYSWANNPQTSSAWTWAQIDSLQAGMVSGPLFVGGGIVTWVAVEVTYSPPSSPTIGEFQAPSSVTSDQYFYLNATINDNDGVSDFNYALLELSGSIQLKWTASGNIFSLYSNPNMYAVLNASACLRSDVNATAYKLSWRMQLTFWTPTGSTDIVSATVKDNEDLTGTNSKTGLFTLSKGTTYTNSITVFTIESSSSISSVSWTFPILTFYTQGNIIVMVGGYGKPGRVKVADVEWSSWGYASSAKNVTITGVSSKVELIFGNYQYTFKGCYNEATGLLIGNVSVVVYSFNGEGQTIYLNSTNGYTYVLNLTYPPFCFQFELAMSINMTRLYYPSSDQETIYVWNATGTVNHYSIVFLDSLGFIDDSTKMEVLRYVNGSLRILERVPITRVASTSVWLQYDKPYRLRLISSKDERILEILADDNLQKEVVISGISFSDNVKMAYKYVRVEAFRESGSKITINYEDTLQQTVSAFFEITYQNGTQVYNATLTTSQGSVSWTGANSTLGYLVKATIDHSGLCILTFNYAVPALAEANFPFNIGFLGTLPISTNAFVPVVIILFTAACFSTLTAGVGIVVTVITAGILYYLGWLAIESTTLTLALAFAIILTISMMRRRGTD